MMQERLRKEIVLDAGGLRPIPDEPSRLYRVLPGVLGVTPLPRRVARPRRFASSEAIVRFMSRTVRWEREPNEMCWIIPLDNHGRQMYDRPVLISIGATDSVPMDIITIFRTALIMEAGQIILLHNHPTGEATVSKADTLASLDVARAGRLLRIPLERLIILATEGSRRVPEIQHGKNGNNGRQGKTRRGADKGSGQNHTGTSVARIGEHYVCDGCYGGRQCRHCCAASRLTSREGGDAVERDAPRRLSRSAVRETKTRRRRVRRSK
jgi:hypothetical protein